MLPTLGVDISKDSFHVELSLITSFVIAASQTAKKDLGSCLPG